MYLNANVSTRKTGPYQTIFKKRCAFHAEEDGEWYWQTRSGEGGGWSEKKSPDLRSLEVDISAI